jgi:hypothetical protein
MAIQWLFMITDHRQVSMVGSPSISLDYQQLLMYLPMPQAWACTSKRD